MLLRTRETLSHSTNKVRIISHSTNKVRIIENAPNKGDFRSQYVQYIKVKTSHKFVIKFKSKQCSKSQVIVHVKTSMYSPPKVDKQFKRVGAMTHLSNQ